MSKYLINIISALSLVFVFNQNLFAQSYTVNFSVNINNPTQKEIVDLWQNYLKTNDKKYWLEEEVKNYQNFNFTDMPGILNPSLMKWGFDNKILSITKISNDKFLIKSLFSIQDENKIQQVFVIANVIAQKTGQGFKLSNYLFEHKKNWQIQEFPNFKYIYPPDYKLNLVEAKDAEDFYSKLTKTFDLEQEKITYFITKDCDSIYDLLGFEYIFNKGSGDECGYFESKNNFVFSTEKGGANHYHEITHYLNKFFPNANYLLLTGISAYISKDKAHFGKPLIYHIKRVNEYLEKNKEIDLSKPSNFYSLDEKTNPQYVIGAILCDIILEKGGKDLLIKAFQSTESDEKLMDFFKKYILAKNENLNDKIRKKIYEISKKDDFKNRLEM